MSVHNDLVMFCDCPSCLAGYAEHGIVCPEGEFEMLKQEFIEAWQEEAREAYSRIEGAEAFPALQAVMLADIALQLRKQNELSARIANSLDNLDKSLRSISDNQRM